MAFSNPIIQGEELVRDGFKSSNYVQGVSGWRIARNGGAEFDSQTVRQNLNVGQSITLAGKDLATLLNARALGTVAWIRGFPVVTSTSETQVFFTEVDVLAGRIYEVELMNISADQGNASQIQYNIRYVEGTAAFPTTTSPILALGLRMSQFQLGGIRTLYAPSTNTRLRLLATISSLDGVTVRSWAPGLGAILGVVDLGVAPTQTGVVGSTPPGKTLKEWTISANAHQTYYGDGSKYTGTFTDYMYQGDSLDGKGNRRAWSTFDTAGLANLADAAGVAVADMLICEAYLNYSSWQNGSGIATVGYHNQATLPTGNEGIGIPNKLSVAYSGANGVWFDLKSGGTGAGTFFDAINTGYLKGFMIGAAGGTDQNYRGIAAGATTVNPPKLHLKYYK